MILVVAAAPSHAQQASRPWEFEFHAGGTLIDDAAIHGIASLPPAGSPFTTTVGTPSRKTSSWYFGDGALLLNQVNAALGTNASVIALDPVLESPLIDQRSGASLGLRFSRRISRRFSAELTVDYSFAGWRLTAPALAGVEASRASFVPGMNALIASGPFQTQTVTSVSAIEHRQWRQLFTTGALVVNLKTTGRVIPYATAGAGIVSNIGEAPSVSLTGTYQFQTPVFAVNETDRVTVKSTVEGTGVGVVGGGLKYFVSSRWGIGLDLRTYLTHRVVATVIDTSPSFGTAARSAGIGAAATFTTPSVQFSNNLALGPSNLSGPAISGFRSFSGTSWQNWVNVVAGAFVRF